MLEAKAMMLGNPVIALMGAIGGTSLYVMAQYLGGEVRLESLILSSVNLGAFALVAWIVKHMFTKILPKYREVIDKMSESISTNSTILKYAINENTMVMKQISELVQNNQKSLEASSSTSQDVVTILRKLSEQHSTYLELLRNHDKQISEMIRVIPGSGRARR